MFFHRLQQHRFGAASVGNTVRCMVLMAFATFFPIVTGCNGSLGILEVFLSADVVDETLEVQLHFRALCQFSNANMVLQYSQKVELKTSSSKNILDRLVVQILVSCHEEFHDLHTALLAQTKLSVRMGILAAVLRCTAQGSSSGLFCSASNTHQERKHQVSQWKECCGTDPRGIEVVFHLTAASHDVAAGRIVDTVAGTAGDVHGFQNVDVIAFHLAVSYKGSTLLRGLRGRFLTRYALFSSTPSGFSGLAKAS